MADMSGERINEFLAQIPGGMLEPPWNMNVSGIPVSWVPTNTGERGWQMGQQAKANVVFLPS